MNRNSPDEQGDGETLHVAGGETPAVQQPAAIIFLKGFLLRLAWGSLGFILLRALYWGRFSEIRNGVVLTLIVYLGVCVAGGLYDVSRGGMRPPKARMNRWNLLLVFILLLMIIARALDHR